MDNGNHDFWAVHLPATADDGEAEVVAAAVGQLGGPRLADWAVRLLTGRARPGDDGDPDIALIRGDAAALDPELALDPHLSRWLGARVLVHHWHLRAVDAVRDGLADDSAAVRQMCCRVVAAQGSPAFEAAAPAVEGLLADPEPRVRSAAALALGEVGGGSSASSLRGLLMDPDSVLASAAEDALDRLADRLARPDLRPGPQY